ncbi:hypothetical protein PPTG_13099 [Phytophthora nicotianae INRA-310]|uniref:Uncharacterized protein n=1 Tax=Phytophthora nicotianae (strain INRA-310) TaxID=761204 RepID=W2Q6D4_PHYN3|nr:hypothetical protein PPTG_13099 [Phytophthora nicotianae INRA-310]ETN07790.1 hypothetical protein PPTG_13099 [Phytophthora nicotianae INRA-310]
MWIPEYRYGQSQVASHIPLSQDKRYISHHRPPFSPKLFFFISLLAYTEARYFSYKKSSRMGLRLMCVAGGALALLLLLLTAAILRLAVMLVQIVTLRYTLTIGAVVLACWFVDSRRRRYARGFYSCSRVPQTQRTEEKTQIEEENEAEQQPKQEEQTPVTAAVAPVARETLESFPVQLKKVATAPPSETESEDDDSEVGGASNVNKTRSNSPSRHSQSLLDVRTRSNTTDGEIQRRLATRPRSSSSASDSRCSRTTCRGTGPRSLNADVKERKRRVPRRRADTGMTSSTKHNERSRRATFASKQDAYVASSRSSSDRLEDALRSDGYWIGDFRVQRRLVSRRSHANSPKAN